MKAVVARRARAVTHVAQVAGVGPARVQAAAQVHVHSGGGVSMGTAATRPARQHIAQGDAKVARALCWARRPRDVVGPATLALKVGRRQTLSALAAAAMPVGSSTKYRLRRVPTVRRANTPRNKAPTHALSVQAALLPPRLVQLGAASVAWVGLAAVCWAKRVAHPAKLAQLVAGALVPLLNARDLVRRAALVYAVE